MSGKRLLLINPVCGILSTGRICADIADDYSSQGWEVKIAYGRKAEVPDRYRKYAIRIGNMVGVYLHALISLIFGYHATGWCSRLATKKFVKWADDWNPDVLWLHNLHDNYVNVVELFKWIKTRPKMKVLWTQHDFWAITGCCCYTGDCEEWRQECPACPKGTSFYRRGLFGGSESREYQTKKKSFLGVKDMTLICPSNWLASLFRDSYMNCYPIIVEHNKIDLNIFKPTHGEFRERHGLVGKRVILGVAGFWESPTKGFGDFLTLAKLIDDNTRIVVVGLTSKLLKNLPRNILGIGRTNSAAELAEVYTSADVFFNPTRLDNFPTVNLEARACGCPIITYDTGGCAETVEGYDKAIVLKGKDKNPLAFLRAVESVNWFADAKLRG